MEINERNIRRLAEKCGYRISKSRQRRHLDNLGGYCVINTQTNTVADGVRYDLNLHDIYTWLTSKAMGATVGILMVIMLASTLFAKDKFFPLEITQVNVQKIGDKSHRSSVFTGHKTTTLAITGHTFEAHAAGKIYVLSSAKDLIEPGRYMATMTDHDRAVRIRWAEDGKERQAKFAIDDIRPDVPAAPTGLTTKVLIDPLPAKAAQADPSKFIISPDPASHLAVCIETLTMRDGSQTCLHWADKPGQ